MLALVVYESMFGNTAAVAESISKGLAPSMEVELVEVANAPAAVSGDVDLLVVGAPTHGFSLSRPQTRAEAHKQGGTRGEQATGIREWLTALRLERVPGFATFDTRVRKVRHLPGSAARKAARLGRSRGLRNPVAQNSFWVLDTSGPLAEGELARARDWGIELAETVTTTP